MLEFDSFDYFQDLLALAVVAVPVYFLTPWVRGRRLMLGTTGSYLLFLIAPRLLRFTFPFGRWSSYCNTRSAQFQRSGGVQRC